MYKWLSSHFCYGYQKIRFLQEENVVKKDYCEIYLKYQSRQNKSKN